ncbi:MAG: hypothetical protein SOI66_08555 [Bifidobacterium sp.]
MGDLFEQGKAAMPSLPGASFDPARREIGHTDDTGIAAVDGVRRLAGARHRNMGVHVGLRAFDVEIRSVDGTAIAGLGRVHGGGAATVGGPASILPVVARKPRSWRESPLRADFPEAVRDALDVMDDRERGLLLRNIAASGGANGFAAAIQACRTIIESGRELASTAIDQTARRIAQGDDEPHGPDLTR